MPACEMGNQDCDLWKRGGLGVPDSRNFLFGVPHVG